VNTGLVCEIGEVKQDKFENLSTSLFRLNYQSKKVSEGGFHNCWMEGMSAILRWTEKRLGTEGYKG
jgi:hypothetical protein